MTVPATAAEQAPFIAIAKAKGVPISFNAAASSMKAEGVQKIHLDMNMVNASIANATARAKAADERELAAKLERLATQGTAKQKTDFVMGTGKYYFPEDIEKAVTMGASASTEHVCRLVCYVVCTCVSGPNGANDQVCHEVCRQICY